MRKAGLAIVAFTAVFGAASLPGTGVTPGQAPAAAQAVDEITVQLGAVPPSVAAGACATLRWRVDNVASVRLDGQPVATAGSREVCPPASRSFTLEWRRLDGAHGRQETGVAVVPNPDGPFVAYAVPAGTLGNQPHDGPLGMAFDVVAPIAITHLGAFDSGQDGLRHAIRVAIFDRDAIRSLTEVRMIGGDGELVGGSRFVPLAEPLVLAPGFQGAVVATGYGSAEPNGNGIGGPVRWTTDDGGDAIAFTGSSLWGYPCGQERFGITNSCRDGFPLLVDSGPHNRYAAGTFIYRRR